MTDDGLDNDVVRPVTYTITRSPRVLFINDWSSEDYGVQWMFDGLCDLLGWNHVIEWPFNPYHHLSQFEPRGYDSELSYPRQFLDECQIVEMLKALLIDVVVISSGRTMTQETAFHLAPWLASATTGIAVLDMEDNSTLTVEAYEQHHDLRPALRAIFKREAQAADLHRPVPVHPLPFSYPRSRVQSVWPKDDDAPLVFYHAHDWGWANDSPRHRMVRALSERFGSLADVGLSCETRAPGEPPPGRLDGEEYHRRLGRARIGIALNEGGGSDNNRYWETVAHGCVLVSDRPRHEIPDNFIDGEEAFFYYSIEEALDICARLQADPVLCERVAAAGVRKLLACHTTAARAFYLLRKTAEAYIAYTGKYPSWIRAI